MIRIDTYRTDQDGVPSFDMVKQETYQFADGKLQALTTTTTDTYYGTNWLQQVDYAHDPAGNTVWEHHRDDWDGNGVFEQEWWMDRAFDTSNRIMTELYSSQDFDGDGIRGDYQTSTTYTHNAAGQLTQKHADYIHYGELTGEYRTDIWAYDAAGRMTSYHIDDMTLYDCEITEFYSYNGAGKIAKIKVQDEIRFGDDRPRVTETFSYKLDGSLKEHTVWGTQTEYGWAPWVQTQYLTETPGYAKEQKLIDLGGDFKPDFNIVTETWRNADGNATDVLVSHFEGYHTLIQRDKIDMTWADGVMVDMTTDIDIWDGVVEEHFTSELLVA